MKASAYRWRNSLSSVLLYYTMFLLPDFDWNRQFIDSLQNSKYWKGKNYRIKVDHLWLPLLNTSNVNNQWQHVCAQEHTGTYMSRETLWHTSKYEYMVFPLFFTWMITYLKHCPASSLMTYEIMVIIPHQSTAFFFASFAWYSIDTLKLI